MSMFNKTTKSLYLIFVKIKALSEDPTKTALALSDEEQNTEQTTEDQNIDVNAPGGGGQLPGGGGGQLPGGGGGISSVYLPVTILLEDQIVENLKLNKLNMYKLRAKTTAKLLGSLRPLSISSKSAGVKAGFIKFWKAQFTTTIETIPKGFSRDYNLSFVTPCGFSLDDMEAHLLTNGKIAFSDPSVTYTYERGSAQIIGGRKYKNNS